VNVSCPECRSVFRVDPSRIPSTSIRARCSVCGGVITISSGSSIQEEFAVETGARRWNAPAPHVESAVSQAAQGAGAPAAWDLAGRSAGPTTATPPGAQPEPVQPSSPPSAMAAARPGSSSPIAAPSASTSAPPPPTRTSLPNAGAASSRPSGPTHPVGGKTSPPGLSSGGPSAAPAARPILFPPRPMIPPGAGRSQPPASRPASPGAASSANATHGPAYPPAQPAPTTAAPRTSGATTLPQAPPAPPPSIPARTTQPPATGAAQPPAAAPRAPINPFLANDPNAKAKRLARALVSDLITYFPQKRDEGLRDGTLKQLFKEEIQKSYEEYVAQVGREFAETTPHFQEALNDLLAGGQKVF